MSTPESPITAAQIDNLAWKLEALQAPGAAAAVRELYTLLVEANARADRAHAVIGQIAAMSIWDWKHNDGRPYQEGQPPGDGHEDSHNTLMSLIEQARAFSHPTPEAKQSEVPFSLKMAFPEAYRVLQDLHALNYQAAADGGHDWDTLQPLLDAVDVVVKGTDPFAASILDELADWGLDPEELDDWIQEFFCADIYNQQPPAEPDALDEQIEQAVTQAQRLSREGPLVQVNYLRGRFPDTHAFLEAMSKRFGHEFQVTPHDSVPALGLRPRA